MPTIALALGVILGFQAQIAPPGGVQKELDTLCTGWQLAPVIPEIATEIKTRTPAWPPNLLPGDFNGDGEVDVAVLIECKGSSQLVAFLSTGKVGFSMEILEKPQPYDARQFLHLIRQEYEHDAIGVEFEAIGGHAWVFRNGRWQSMLR
jgi:hypothetical protein